MRLLAHSSTHIRTAYVALDRSRCQACWSCVQACPNGVLGKAELGPHRHAHVDAADRCAGCCRCVKACPSAAVRARPAA